MNILTSVFFTLVATPALALVPCGGNLEAEVIAQYNHVDLSYAEAGNPEHTTFDFKNFKYYKENQICPLPQELGIEAQITEYRLIPGADPGAEISGILVYNTQLKIFSIVH